METIKMTELDYSGLNNVIERTKSKNEKRLNLPVLKNEISKAKVVNSTKIAEDFVTLNSLVEILDFDTNKKWSFAWFIPKKLISKKEMPPYFRRWGEPLLAVRREISSISMHRPGEKK